MKHEVVLLEDDGEGWLEATDELTWLVCEFNRSPMKPLLKWRELDEFLAFMELRYGSRFKVQMLSAILEGV